MKPQTVDYRDVVALHIYDTQVKGIAQGQKILINEIGVELAQYFASVINKIAIQNGDDCNVFILATKNNESLFEVDPQRAV